MAAWLLRDCSAPRDHFSPLPAASEASQDRDQPTRRSPQEPLTRAATVEAGISAGINSDGAPSWAPLTNGSPRHPLLRAIKRLTPPMLLLCASEVARFGHATVEASSCTRRLEVPSWLHSILTERAIRAHGCRQATFATTCTSPCAPFPVPDLLLSSPSPGAAIATGFIRTELSRLELFVLLRQEPFSSSSPPGNLDDFPMT